MISSCNDLLFDLHQAITLTSIHLLSVRPYPMKFLIWIWKNTSEWNFNEYQNYISDQFQVKILLLMFSIL